MNKLGLFSLILAGASLTMVGCASNSTPETAQSSSASVQSDASIAQSTTTDIDAQNLKDLYEKIFNQTYDMDKVKQTMHPDLYAKVLHQNIK